VHEVTTGKVLLEKLSIAQLVKKKKKKHLHRTQGSLGRSKYHPAAPKLEESTQYVFTPYISYIFYSSVSPTWLHFNYFWIACVVSVKVKDKIVSVLNQLSIMPWRHMRNEDTAPQFFNVAQNGGEWSASRPGCHDCSSVKLKSTAELRCSQGEIQYRSVLFVKGKVVPVLN
jgi:hypothetical protein